MGPGRSQDVLAALAVFVAVVESGGFAAAARRLGMTRSAVSKQVARLEEAWGVRLLRRTTRAVSTTEPGRQAYEHASRIPALADLARRAASGLSQTPRGVLRVTTSVAFGQHVVVPLLPAFRERHPQVDVELHLLDRFVDLVDEGFDLAIRLSDRLPEGMVARKLGPIGYHLCAAPDLAGVAHVREPPDVEALPALRLAGRGTKEPWLLSRGGEQVALSPRATVRANTSDALLCMARSGLGVALLPDYVLGESLERGELVALLPEWTVAGPFGSHAWAVRPERQALPKVCAFTDFLAERPGEGWRAPQAVATARARAAWDTPP